MERNTKREIIFTSFNAVTFPISADTPDNSLFSKVCNAISKLYMDCELRIRDDTSANAVT